MQTEVEAKFLGANHDVIRAKLRELGATREHSNRLMRRRSYDFPGGLLGKANGWVRVRDEGDKVTMSYKQLNDRTLHGTKEVTLVVSDFETAHQFLEAIGLEANGYYETKRESWLLGSVEIELDEWPWIKPFIEIEGPDEVSVKRAAKLLELDWIDAVHGSVEIAYQAEYDVTEAEVDSWPEGRFTPVPAWLEAKRKR